MQRVIERLLNLLALLLTSDRPVTADEIRFTVAGYGQETDEAFRRTFERDKDLLRELGIPLRLQATDAWEVEHGYVVRRDEYALPDPDLTDEERVALWVAAQAVRLGGSGPGPEAIFKLGGAPMAVGGDPLAADLGESLEMLADIFSALTERRLVSFRYRDRSRVAAPYGLAHRRGHWYLVAAPEGEPEVRAYRIDRMQDLRMLRTPGAFQRPHGFRVGDHLPHAPWESGPGDTVVEVRLDPSVAWWAVPQLTSRAEISTESDGGVRARFPVASMEAFIGWMIGFDDQAEVLSPVEVRQRFVAHITGRT